MTDETNKQTLSEREDSRFFLNNKQKKLKEREREGEWMSERDTFSNVIAS